MSNETTDLFGEVIKEERKPDKKIEPVIVRRPESTVPFRPYRIIKESKLVTWIMND
jgi:hypothetical protein